MTHLASSTPVIWAMSQLFVSLYAMIGILSLFYLMILPIIYLCVMAWNPVISAIRGKYTKYDNY